MKTVGAAERENLLGQAKSSPCVNKSKLGLEVDKSPILKSTRRSFEIKSARLNAKSARPYSGILENDDGFGSKKFKNQARKQNQDEDTQGLSLKSLQITSEPAADSRASEATIDIKSTPLFMPDQVIDGNCLTIPTFSSGNSIAPPQALGRFTLENIVALVDTVKMAHLTLHDDHQLFDRLGRTTTPFRASSFVDGSARSREKSVAFGKQSIISILSCPSSLLKSFVTLTADGTIDSRNYAGYLEIVEAFRSLGKIDHHPKSVFPSLCTSTRKIHKPQNLRLRNQNIKICKAIESDFGSPIRDHALDTYDDGVLDDVEAAHIVKIILAALAASVPESDLDVWYHYRTLRTLGRSAPRPKTVRDDKILTNSLLALMDSFEDEMALGLMTRLVKAITARCCVSKMSRYQEAGANEENLGALGSNFMYCILRDILVDGVEDRYIMMPLQFNDAWLDTHFDYLQNVRFIRATCMVEYERDDPSLRITIIVEWLRSVILKEWDGKAEVSRWGAVGSALEFMSCLCMYISFVI